MFKTSRSMFFNLIVMHCTSILLVLGIIGFSLNFRSFLIYSIIPPPLLLVLSNLIVSYVVYCGSFLPKRRVSCRASTSGEYFCRYLFSSPLLFSRPLQFQCVIWRSDRGPGCSL